MCAGMIATDRSSVIVGLGKTGLSCARFLARAGRTFRVMDSRAEPPGAAELCAEFPEVRTHFGSFSASFLEGAAEVLVSPGVAIAEPVLQDAQAQGVRLSGDIDLFAREARKPIIAITGSNAKSTVTTLVGELIRHGGHQVAVGGNIGTPALDLLAQDEPDYYVLELSSFQLETTTALGARVATVLNISADHMDRYAGLPDYHRAKHRIYHNCAHAVVNRDDALTRPLLPESVRVTSFGLGTPDLKDFGISHRQDGDWLMQGAHALIRTNALRMRGRHNHANVLAALALGDAIGLEMGPMLEAAREFPGLPHRCQWVAESDDVQWYNDSKGTNVGATVAALEGLGSELNEGRLVLIAGGDGKGADFSGLRTPVERFVRAVILIGRDAPRLRDALDGACELLDAGDMAQAVATARARARAGDAVLLSPACASFDMFRGFEHRGEVFVAAVRAALSGGAA